MIIANEQTHFFGSVKDVCVYDSNYNQFKDSKIKYHVRKKFLDIYIRFHDLCMLQRFCNR